MAERQQNEGALGKLLSKADETIKHADKVTSLLEENKDEAYIESIARHMNSYEYMENLVSSLLDKEQREKAELVIAAYNRAADATGMRTMPIPE